MLLPKINNAFFRKLVLLSLSFMLVLASCKKDSSTPAPTPADKTALQAKVAEAQTLYDGSVEGTKPGQYEAGSNALAQLTAAMDTFKTHLITEIASANLIGYWKMNGNANDSSGNGNNGVLTAGHAYFGAGMPTLTADRFGRPNMAYHFDKGGNIDVPYKASLNPQQMSISVWVKWSSDGRTLNKDTYTIAAMN